MVRILGLGAYAPEGVLRNDDFTRFMDTDDEWITSRSGIKSRRIAPANVLTSDLALEASRMALDRAGLSPRDLDMIIVATSSPDTLTPSTACVLSAKLGAGRIPCFDISAACPGFLYALEVARGLLRTGSYRYILIVGVESGTKFIDWHDRGTAVLFGDGAGAAVLTEDESRYGVLATYLKGDGRLGDLLKIEVGTAYPPGSWGVRMKGREVFRNAIVQMGEAAVEVLKRAGMTAEDIDWLVPHQANLRIIEATRERLNLPKEKVFVNIHRYGNTSAASIPLALNDMLEENLLREGQNVLAVSFGAGFTWASAVIRWG
ncbi:MAG: ketoacyl-ACP synthase III [Thermotogae bacterium]|nr:ketoacyl-ACP synthase III [Thermotogota bacterium]